MNRLCLLVLVSIAFANVNAFGGQQAYGQGQYDQVGQGPFGGQVGGGYDKGGFGGQVAGGYDKGGFGGQVSGGGYNKGFSGQGGYSGQTVGGYGGQIGGGYAKGPAVQAGYAKAY